jgi:3-carboxy-cis,cis-muconate cycloisomerase
MTGPRHRPAASPEASAGLFGPLFVPEGIRELTSDRAWLQAMLDAEAALAAAQAEAGIVPPEAATEIAAACEAERFDVGELGREGRLSASPVVPLVAALRRRLSDRAARFVHWGATSQDVMDTAAMLVARRSLSWIDGELEGVAAACARLAEEHRETPMAARTLLGQALPITFGLKAAGWLDAVMDARERLGDVLLTAQLGGAAGTLASLGGDGIRVLELFSHRLKLSEPRIPWHTARLRVAELGAALGLASGVLQKLALDLVLLSQTEVGEVAEKSGGGRGGSSALPQKRNPVGSVLAIACARRVHGAVSVLLAAMAQEHERAAGAWQAEWESLREALALTGGAAASAREALEGLEVRPDRMRRNLEATGGMLMAESVSMALAERIGAERAQELMTAACRRATETGTTLREELASDPEVSGELSSEEIERALDPARYLGSAQAFVDRVLAAYGEARRAMIGGEG